MSGRLGRAVEVDVGVGRDGFVMLGGAFNDVASSGDPTGGALGCWKGLPQSDLNHAGPAQGIRCCADD